MASSNLKIKVIRSVFFIIPFFLLSVIHGKSDASSEVLGKRNHININITTHLGDHQTFMEGDVISFFLSLDKDAYLLVIYELYILKG